MREAGDYWNPAACRRLRNLWNPPTLEARAAEAPPAGRLHRPEREEQEAERPPDWQAAALVAAERAEASHPAAA